jgi:hypothetical protein
MEGSMVSKQARVIGGVYRVGQVVTVVAPYSGPFGPSVVVRFDDGKELAMRLADLAEL